MPFVPHHFNLYRGDRFVCGENKKKKTFTSTSFGIKEASTFSKCVLIINIPPGAKILPLLTITRYPAELEVLLPRDSRFTYHSKS